MKLLLSAAAISLLGHAAFWGRQAPEVVQPRVDAPLLWVAPPPMSVGRRGAGPPARSSSSIKAAGARLSAGPSAEWRAMGDLVALGNTPPTYPAEALEREWEGVVRLSVEFGEEGLAEAVAVESSSGHAVLDRAAVEAARRWHLSGNGPRRRLLVPVSFRLSEEG